MTASKISRDPRLGVLILRVYLTVLLETLPVAQLVPGLSEIGKAHTRSELN